MTIEVTKLTDVNLLRTVAGDTTGNESHMSLAKAYAFGHSPTRTQIFLIRLKDIPQFVASQLVRHKVGAEWWMKSKRTDRGGINFTTICSVLGDCIRRLDLMPSQGKEETAQLVEDLPTTFDRLAPTDLTGVLNAQAIVNISLDRLCAAASPETREIWQGVVNNIAQCDEELAKHCVRPCVATGICREKKCKYIHSDLFRTEREAYKRLFL